MSLSACVADALRKNAVHMPIVPPILEQRIWATGNEAGRARLICDHLASLTDVSATRTYKRLFDPTYGSITDLV